LGIPRVRSVGDRREFPFAYPHPMAWRGARPAAAITFTRGWSRVRCVMARESSYYAGGSRAGETSYRAQESALRYFQRLQNLAKRGLTGGDLLEVGCGFGYLLDLARPFLPAERARIFT
jgi:hypothetical protein